MIKLKIPEYPFFFSTSLHIFCTAIAHRGVLEEGFQIDISPQTAAINAFHAHTATGKLKAEIIPTFPKWMPLLIHSVFKPFRMHC